jgi:hypothetical protein
MRTSELRAMLPADERHRWYRGRRRVLAAALDRLSEWLRHDHRRADSHLQMTTSRLDGVLELPLRARARLPRHGVRLPAGLSLLAVLRRS